MVEWERKYAKGSSKRTSRNEIQRCSSGNTRHAKGSKGRECLASYSALRKRGQQAKEIFHARSSLEKKGEHATLD